MIFQRHSLKKLLQWKGKSGRKPLIIRGARQVGKSTLVKEFSKEFKQFISLNLELPKHQRYFHLDSIDEIVAAIFLEHKSVLIEDTLLFIDEIQESPKAIQMLRYFYEKYPSIHVIAAGSLLEFVMKEITSFPVGRVEQMVLHPFGFEEFLEATDQAQLIEELNKIPLTKYAHTTLLTSFHQYAMIGGMPEVIQQFVKDQSALNLAGIYEGLWQGYVDDVEKYGTSASIRQVIRHVIQTAPSEKDRISFAGFGASNYKSREVGEALRALDKARLIRLIYPIINDQLPVQVDYKRKPRLQFLDTGLLNFTLGLQPQMIGIKDLNAFHRGKIIQHLVSQELQSMYDQPSFKPNFWVRENPNSNSEVDLIYVFNGHVIPVEIKSGLSGKLRSLHEFIDRTDRKIAVRLSANYFSIEYVKTPSGTPYKLINIPYYLMCRLPQYLNQVM